MPKWERSKQDDRRQIQGVDDGRYIGHAIIPADADAICRAHNADIDALTAERDEWQSRCESMVAKISEAVVSDDDCVCSMLCYSAVIAIAEGRDNE